MFGGRFSSSIGLVGVDFGSRFVRLLQIREHQQRLHVVGAAQIEMMRRDEDDREGSAAPGSRASLLTRQLHSALSHGGFTGRRCVVCLPRHAVRVQSIRLPSMPDHELRDAIGWEAAQRFDFDRGAMEADYIRTGATLQAGENREEVLLTAASHAAIHEVLDPLMNAGLRPVAVETHFTALTRVFSRQLRRETDQSQVRAIVDVGATGSTVIIARGDQIAFTKPIDIGGDDFDRAVQEHLELDERAAAELRAARISAVSAGNRDEKSESATERAVYEAVRPLLGDLAKEIVLCLRYYGVTFRGRPPERIILAGGNGLEPNLDDTIARAAKVPVVFDEPIPALEPLTQGLKVKLHSDPGPATCWSVVAGLSARGLGAVRRPRVREAALEGRRGAA